MIRALVFLFLLTVPAAAQLIQTSPAPSNGAVGGDLSGALPNPTVAKIGGIAVIAPTQAGTVQVSSGCSIVSASTTDIGASCSPGQLVTVTGTTTITSLGSTAAAGTSWLLYFPSALTLTNGASLNLPRAINLTTVATTSLVCYVPVTAGTWFCTYPPYNTNVSISPAGFITASGTVTGSGLTTNTSFIGHVRLPADAASVAIASTDNEVGLITATQAVAANLNSSPATGQTDTICDISGSGNVRNITVTPNAGNIDGSATFVINTAWGCWTGFYTGVIWKTVSSR